MRSPLFKDHSHIQTVFKVAIALAFLFSSVAISMKRSSIWENDITLWSDAVHKAPYKARSNYELGASFAEQGNAGLAYYYYEQSVRIDGGRHMRQFMMK